MASPGDQTDLKTAGDLQVWLNDELGPGIETPTLAYPHGGTALTLLGLKESTKDVDLGFTSRDDFRRVVRALKQLRYKTTMDIQATPNEHLVRLENSERRVDVVDLRWPTWNNWHITQTVMANALQIPFGNLVLVRLDRDVIFLFKTYPVRDTDLADLRAVLDAVAPDETRIISLFEEQDVLHRRELTDANTPYEPLFRILDLRVRVAGSLSLIGADYRRRVPRLSRHADQKFRELGLSTSLRRLVQTIRSAEGWVSWDEIAGSELERLRERLVVPGHKGGRWR